MGNVETTERATYSPAAPPPRDGQEVAIPLQAQPGDLRAAHDARPPPLRALPDRIHHALRAVPRIDDAERLESVVRLPPLHPERVPHLLLEERPDAYSLDAPRHGFEIEMRRVDPPDLLEIRLEVYPVEERTEVPDGVIAETPHPGVAGDRDAEARDNERQRPEQPLDAVRGEELAGLEGVAHQAAAEEDLRLLVRLDEDIPHDELHPGDGGLHIGSRGVEAVDAVIEDEPVPVLRSPQPADPLLLLKEQARHAGLRCGERRPQAADAAADDRQIRFPHAVHHWKPLSARWRRRTGAGAGRVIARPRRAVRSAPPPGSRRRPPRTRISKRAGGTPCSPA